VKHIRKRLQKLNERIRPDDDGFTFGELCRAIWRKDKKSFRRLVAQDSRFAIYLAEFELEDANALRAAKAARSGGSVVRPVTQRHREYGL
jgi:hypothetical protein